MNETAPCATCAWPRTNSAAPPGKNPGIRPPIHPPAANRTSKPTTPSASSGSRIAGDYRLLFEISQAETLHLTDFILRRDLDRWLAGGGK
jgi:hypothetical protein